MTKQKEYILAIDQGTFSSRAVIYDDTGQSIQCAHQSIALNRIDSQQVEQDAEEILQSVEKVVDTVLNSNAIKGLCIKSAGLATQRSSIVAWQPTTGKALSPVLSWQDTRAAPWLSGFKSQACFIQKVTGLRLSPHYGASKINWLLENNPLVQKAVSQNDCVITPVASFLLYHLTANKQINIDIANASRSLLCNLSKRDWDDDLLKLFSIERNILANIKPVKFNYGTIKNSPTVIKAVNGDQTAALYSNGRPKNNSLRVNLGTGAFVLTSVHEKQIDTVKFINSGLLAGISDSADGKACYYIEGTVNGAGSAIQWLERKLLDKNIKKMLQKGFGNIQPGIFINSVGGFGSPVWRSDIAPYFLDELDINKSPQKGLVAVLESIVFLLHLNIERIQSIKGELEKIEISGGLSNIDFLCQLLANLSLLKVERSEDPEATSRGIAWLALRDRKLWKRVPVEKSFYAENDISLKARYDKFKACLTDAYGISL